MATALTRFAAARGPGDLPYHSPTALAMDAAGRYLYAADKTAAQIVQVDVRSGKVMRRIALPCQPTGLALNGAANRLYVTAETPANAVYVLNLASGNLDSVMPAGHGPGAPALSADGSVLYVCNRFDHDVSVIGLAAKREITRVPVVREPGSAALTPDGKWLVVGNAEPAGPATASQVAAVVSLIDTGRNQLAASIHLPNGGMAVRGVAVSPDSRYAFVSHVLARNRVPATQLEEGWLAASAVTVIDLEARTRLGTFLLDQTHRGAGNPWGIAVSEDGRKLCVSLAGVHELAVIDLPGVIEKLKASGAVRIQPASYRPVGAPDTDFTFMRSYLKRIHLQGRAPRPVLIRGGRAYAGMYFSGSIESIDLDGAPVKPQLFPLGPQPVQNEARRGEMLSHDATVSFQGWISCSSCHPDGRSDGLNWDLTNDGIGDSNNTKSLLFSDRTPPVTWTGRFASLDECVPFEIRTILFASRPNEDAVAIAAYLKSLKPVPSPYLENGGLGASALRGKQVFEQAGCSECHHGAYFTAMKKRGVGTAVPGDHGNTFDIPSLREVWRTAPYLHDGRAATVKDIFTTFDPGNLHGKHAALSGAELDDLVRYVLSL